MSCGWTNKMVIWQPMNIQSSFDADVRSTDRPSGGYEWWYFDAMTEDDRYSIVIIFYEGNPFSTRYNQRLVNGDDPLPDDHPAISISVYEQGSPIYYSFTEFDATDCSFNAEHPKVTVGPHSMKGTDEGGKLCYTLQLDEELPSGDGLQAKLRFESSKTEIFSAKNSGEGGHLWNLVQPRAEVTGRVRISQDKTGTNEIAFEGTGYHDHNTGREPMREEFSDWYWGRFHFDYGTLVYYVMNRRQTEQHKAWLMSPDSGHLLQTYNEIDLVDRGLTVFGLKTARKIGLRSGNSQVQVQQSELFDNGPFYQRYRSEAFLRIPAEGVVESCKGITEYIRPDRIYARMFWPFVNMRIRYQPEKPHWVQKSKMLYRWTW